MTNKADSKTTLPTEVKLTKKQRKKEVSIMGMPIMDLSREQLETALYHTLNEQKMVDKLISKAYTLLENALP